MVLTSALALDALLDFEVFVISNFLHSKIIYDYELFLCESS